MIKFLIRVTEAIQRGLVRIQAASAINPGSQCPGCVRSDRYADRSGHARLNHQPALFAIRTANGMVVMACRAHAMFIVRQRGYLSVGKAE
jgi:hypothetical protein